MADDIGAVEEAFILDNIQHRQGCGQPDGRAAIGSSQTARADDVHHISAPYDPGNRKAAAQRLRDGKEVRLDRRMFNAEHLAGSGEAGLNFVRDQQNAMTPPDII